MIKDHRVVAIIEARMTSSRLAGKVMAPIRGKPMLEQMIRRVKRAQLVDQVVVATTTNPEDDGLVKLAKKLRVGWFRGSEEDVLSRVLAAANKYRADLIVELTGDCPLIDHRQIDQGVDLLLKSVADYVANCTSHRTVPHGFDVQVFWFRVLKRAAQRSTDRYHREHVSLFIWEHPEIFSLKSFGPPVKKRRLDLRLTVDTDKDLELVRRIFRLLEVKKPDFGYDEVIELFRRYPWMARINRGVDQKSARFSSEEDERLRRRLIKGFFTYQPRWRAAIVGLGRIGSEFDSDPKREEVSSHAGAYQIHPEVQLVAVADIQSKKRRAFKKRWGEVKVYANAAEMFRKERIDIVSIATKNDQHYPVARQAIKSQVKAIFCEKPFTDNPQKAIEVVKLCRQKGISLIIDYNRRFDRMHRRLKAATSKQALGKCLGGIAYYSNGLINAASHAVDLVDNFCGPVVAVQTINRGGNQADPDLDVILTLKSGGSLLVKAVSVNHYYQFELDALFESGRVRIVNQGTSAELYRTLPHPEISHLRQLSPQPQRFRRGKYNTLPQAIAHLVRVLDGQEPPWSTGEPALRVLEILAAAHLSDQKRTSVKLPLKKKNVILSSQIKSK